MRTAPVGRRGEVVYEVYLRSFQDGDGDGVGDLAGLERRLPYLAGLGVDILWLSPLFRSPMRDFGYDVSDYRAVDPLFGDAAALHRVIARAHTLGLKVMLDLVPSHTSDQHPWFVESAADRINPRADWYVWADPKADGSPPNNWLSVFGGVSWQWDARRRQYYLHNFLVSQPDLNFHCPEVPEAMLAVARFWLDRGVDGFRLDVVNYVAHDQRLRSNPPAPADRVLRVTSRANPYGWQDHRYDNTRPEALGFVERLRATADAYGAVLMGELVTDSAPERQARRYTAPGRLHQVYTFDLFGPWEGAEAFRRAAERLYGALGRDGWVAWALSNHDVPRVASRWGFGDQAAAATPALVALLCSLRGTPCLYQGDELGLVEAEVPFERLQDPYGREFWPEYKGRDGCRTPMPWDADAPQAGFSQAEPWLPLDERHRERGIDKQEAEPGSTLQRVRRFLHWRRTQPALLTGVVAFLDAPEPVIAFRRGKGRGAVLVAINIGREPVRVAIGSFRDAVPLDGHGLPGDLGDGVLDLPPFGAVFASTRR